MISELLHNTPFLAHPWVIVTGDLLLLACGWMLGRISAWHK
jgi:hypothetical protein